MNTDVAQPSSNTLRFMIVACVLAAALGGALVVLSAENGWWWYSAISFGVVALVAVRARKLADIAIRRRPE